MLIISVSLPVALDLSLPLPCLFPLLLLLPPPRVLFLSVSLRVSHSPVVGRSSKFFCLSRHLSSFPSSSVLFPYSCYSCYFLPRPRSSSYTFTLYTGRGQTISVITLVFPKVKISLAIYPHATLLHTYTSCKLTECRHAPANQ